MAREAKSAKPEPPQGRCPMCGRPRDPSYRPFCSPRCRDQDLVNWLEDRYAIPAQEREADEDEPERGLD
jgi:endogenous inhibitor of DNA gyrase (YacG/DUF329 family)